MQKEVPFMTAAESRYPEQVAIILARDPQEKINAMTAGWVMLTSHRPPMIAVSVGKTRYTLEAIRYSREFVVAFPSEDQAPLAKLFGSKSGRTMDKLKASGAVTQSAKAVNGQLLADAVANFECRLTSELETGDHVVFVGEVLCSYVTENPANRLYTLLRNQTMGGVRQNAP